ncbi:MAG: DNA repair protein RecO [Deltaproteobacteria bacterium]|nr:DNA repair protein RecO [Deltaproteobacteria bacterium]
MILETAFILRAVNYGESDRIYTLYTQGHGKLSAIAKAARKSTKRFGGALQPFAVFEVALTPSRRGSSNMYTIGEATMVAANDGLSKNLSRLGIAAFLLELLREVAPEHESSAPLFDVGKEALALLSDTCQLHERNLLLSAGMRILAQSGLAMSVGRCNACGRPVPPGKPIYFDALRGGVVCTPCGGGPILLDAQCAAAFRFLATHPIAESAALSIDPPVLDAMESAFIAFIHMHLEKQLKTPGFMSQISARDRQDSE